MNFFTLRAGAEFFFSSGARVEPEPIFLKAPEPELKKVRALTP